MKTKKKFFYLTSKALFVFEIIKILNFQIFIYHEVIKWLSIKHETYIDEQLGKRTQSGNEIWPL